MARDDAINYVADDFAAEANRLTGGRGVDLILDAVGATTMDKGLTCLAPFGHLILYGRAGGPPEPLNVFRLFEKSIKVSGFVLVHSGRGARHDAARNRGVVQTDRGGKVKLLVGKSFPLAQAAEAHKFMESRQSTGKLVLIP